MTYRNDTPEGAIVYKSPVKPGLHWQVNSLMPSVHVASLRHGLLAHSFRLYSHLLPTRPQPNHNISDLFTGLQVPIRTITIRTVPSPTIRWD